MSKAPKSSKAGGEKETEFAELSYEQAVERLEGIIDRIESGEAGLEQSLVEYEKGMALLARCREILARAEQRIIELNPGAPGAGSRGGGSSADESPPARRG